MDNWEKTQRQKRFRNKTRHDRKRRAQADPHHAAPREHRKIVRERIDPNTWSEDEDFYGDGQDDFEEFSDSA